MRVIDFLPWRATFVSRFLLRKHYAPPKEIRKIEYLSTSACVFYDSFPFFLQKIFSWPSRRKWKKESGQKVKIPQKSVFFFDFFSLEEGVFFEIFTNDLQPIQSRPNTTQKISVDHKNMRKWRVFNGSVRVSVFFFRGGKRYITGIFLERTEIAIFKSVRNRHKKEKKHETESCSYFTKNILIPQHFQKNKITPSARCQS